MLCFSSQRVLATLKVTLEMPSTSVFAGELLTVMVTDPDPALVG